MLSKNTYRKSCAYRVFGNEVNYQNIPPSVFLNFISGLLFRNVFSQSISAISISELSNQSEVFNQSELFPIRKSSAQSEEVQRTQKPNQSNRPISIA